MLSHSLTNDGFEGFSEPKAVTAGSKKDKLILHYFGIVNNLTPPYLRELMFTNKITSLIAIL